LACSVLLGKSNTCFSLDTNKHFWILFIGRFERTVGCALPDTIGIVALYKIFNMEKGADWVIDQLGAAEQNQMHCFYSRFVGLRHLLAAALGLYIPCLVACFGRNARQHHTIPYHTTQGFSFFFTGFLDKFWRVAVLIQSSRSYDVGD